MAIYRCQTCRRVWEAKPKPQVCQCGSIRIDWLNYEKDHAKLWPLSKPAGH